MTPNERLATLDVVYFVGLAAILILVVAPLIPKVRKLNIGWRYLLAVVLTWMFSDFFRAQFQLPVLYEIHADDPLYDGVGGNVVVMMMGWIPGLLLGFPIFCFCLWRSRQQNRAEQDEDAKPDNAPS